VQRFLCPKCGHTVSVLPGTRLPYRALEVGRLQGFFDAQAEVSAGLDPPPGLIEAGCLQRAWNRFLTRVNLLKESFGQLLPVELHTPQHLWKELRRTMGSAEEMLRFLACHCKRSLLGDYACLHRAVWFGVGGSAGPEGDDPTKGFSSPEGLGALNREP
jgi:hypothetical protein